MEITTELVNHLAELSRLEFDEMETENFKNEFAKTLGQMESLDRVDTSSVELKQNSLNAETEIDADNIHTGLSKDDATKNAPDKLGSSIAVPMMVD
jgi:aspartyl-tRNA(Asn)/glutamyl-tRNA(Gln) amidotransferase subunit C